MVIDPFYKVKHEKWNDDDKPIYLKTSEPLMELEFDKGYKKALEDVEQIFIKMGNKYQMYAMNRNQTKFLLEELNKLKGEQEEK